MKTKVDLKELIETPDIMLDEHLYYLNRKTFDILDIDTDYYAMVEDGSYQDKIKQLRDWEIKNIKEIIDFFENEDDYLPIPSKYEINEYHIMESFCFELDEDKMNMCLNSIKGRGAFRRFKDLIYSLNIEKDWYKYKEQKLKEIATYWCCEHGLPYDNI